MKYRFVEREKYFESKTSLSSLRSLNRLLGKNKWIKKKIKTKGRKLRSYSESFERSIYFLNVRFDGFTSVISSRYSRSDLAPLIVRIIYRVFSSSPGLNFSRGSSISIKKNEIFPSIHRRASKFINRPMKTRAFPRTSQLSPFERALLLITFFTHV